MHLLECDSFSFANPTPGIELRITCQHSPPVLAYVSD